MPKAKAKTTTTKKRATTSRKTTTTRKKQPKKTWMQRAFTDETAASQPFMQTKITNQTLYWLIFGAISIAFALWILTLDAKIREIYDYIDTSTYSVDEMDMNLQKKKSQNNDTKTETTVEE